MRDLLQRRYQIDNAFAYDLKMLELLRFILIVMICAIQKDTFVLGLCLCWPFGLEKPNREKNQETPQGGNGTNPKA